ncbi:MAG: hypothetical protein IJY93_07830 [Clostridia bacterium]|nr:hypothetical protein [Clostridia bacterium]
MSALLYLLGFVSGIGIAVVIMLIIAAKRKKAEAENNFENSFNNILNY